MSLLNPGKRGIYTLLSVLLIIGVPGMIAYVDSSSDTYYSLWEDGSEPNQVLILSNGSYFTFNDITVVEEEDGHSVIVSGTATDESTVFSDLTPSLIAVYDTSLSMSTFPDKIVISTDLPVSGASVTFKDSASTTVANFDAEYDESSGSYVLEFSAVEAASYSDAVRFTVGFDIEDDAVVSDTFFVDVNLYSAESIFTDDVVELIVLVGGILLLVLGTMALSFFDVGTPGKAFRSAGRSVRNIARRK